MTLKEKFDVISCNDCDMPYCEIKCTILNSSELDKLEKIADDYAIEFAEWCVSKEKLDLVHDLILIGELNRNYTTKQLLEIYKIEKGL